MRSTFVFIPWQAQHFRKVRYRFRGRRSTFARTVQIVAGAMLSQVRYRFRGRRRTFARSGTEFCKVRYRYRGRHRTFARSGTHLAAGAALSRGAVQLSRQAQHFHKVEHCLLSGAGRAAAGRAGRAGGAGRGASRGLCGEWPDFFSLAPQESKALF